MILWSALALGAPCTLDAPPDTPFAVEPPAASGGARLVVVVRADDADPALVGQVFTTLERHGGHGTLAVRVDREPSAVIAALAPALTDRDHTLAARIPTGMISPDPERGARRLRKTLRPVQSVVGRFRALDGAAGRAGIEAVLHRVGVRALLETNGPPVAEPRAQQRMVGQPDNGVILPRGPYAGPCGTDHSAHPFTPPAADRVTQALHGAAGARVGIVRVTLAPTDADEVAVLDRWLQTVVVPSGVPVMSAEEARTVALAGLRDRLPTTAAAPMVGGRLVGLDQLRAAARDLEGATALPRQLSGEVNPTEAFQGMALLLSGRVEQDVVRLAALRGPPQLASSVLRRPVEVPRAAVVALAAALLDDLPEAVPPALSIGGQLLTAPELLTVFASAVRGDDPARAHPIDVPDPSVPGLGWGTSQVP